MAFMNCTWQGKAKRDQELYPETVPEIMRLYDVYPKW